MLSFPLIGPVVSSLEIDRTARRRKGLEQLLHRVAERIRSALKMQLKLPSTFTAYQKMTCVLKNDSACLIE